MQHSSTSSTAAAERASLEPTSPMWGEHRSRYHFANNYVAGRTVLDIACGTGFGGPILLRQGKAARVIGMDMSWDGLMQARRELVPGYHLCRADGTRLPLPDGALDAITSFETLEHIPRYEDFVAELRRVLSPGGVLILPTPNALYTRPVDGVPRNPFHVREFTPGELRALLGEHFGQVELLGQRTHPRYRICPFWELPESLPRDLKGRLQVVTWKVQNRLPYAVKDGLSRMVRGRAFYPGEHDFIFSPEEVETGYVLVAVCRP